MTLPDRVEVAVVGGGPAGAQCVLWLTKLGIDCLLLEPGTLGGLQARSPFTNSWLAVVQATTAARSVARNIEDNLSAQGCRVAGERCTAVSASPDGFALTLAGGGTLSAGTVVLATGTRERTGGLESLPGVEIGLVGTAALDDIGGRDVVILGGGDAACEAHAILSARDPASLHLFARTRRARDDLWDAIPAAHRHTGAYMIEDGAVHWSGGAHRFDRALVCYGWAPAVPTLPGTIETDAAGHLVVDAVCRTNLPGLYAVGDVNGRGYPCVATALADGVIVAKDIERRRGGTT